MVHSFCHLFIARWAGQIARLYKRTTLFLAKMRKPLVGISLQEEVRKFAYISQVKLLRHFDIVYCVVAAVVQRGGGGDHH